MANAADSAAVFIHPYYIINPHVNQANPATIQMEFRYFFTVFSPGHKLPIEKQKEVLP